VSSFHSTVQEESVTAGHMLAGRFRVGSFIEITRVLDPSGATIVRTSSSRHPEKQSIMEANSVARPAADIFIIVVLLPASCVQCR
jgi:hypothetical protein